MSEPAEASLKLDEWLAELRRAAQLGAAAGGVPGGGNVPAHADRAADGPVAAVGQLPAVDRRSQAALLDLARVAAHRSERIAAPISTYLVGLAAAAIPEDERAAWLERTVAALENERRG